MEITHCARTIASKDKLCDLWELHDLKRVKAYNSGYSVLGGEYESTLNYLDDAIAEKYNYEWR